MTRFLLVLVFIFSYVGLKLTQLLTLHPVLLILLSLFLILLTVGPIFFIRSKPIYFGTVWYTLFSWVGSTLIGFWGTFLLLSIPIDVTDLLFSAFNHGHGFMTPEYYQIILFASITMVVLGFLYAMLGPRIVNVSIPIENLSPALQNFKIAQISDLHIGSTIQSRYVRRVVNRTNAENPDIVVISGDLVDAPTEAIKEHLLPFRDLKSKYGVYYVTGNHEYYWGIQSLFAELESVGFTILQNSSRVIEVNKSKILLAGIPDPAGAHFGDFYKPNLTKARTSAESTDLNILLSHRPDPYENAEKLGFHIQFSGHTHAGQFFPFSLLIAFAHKYYRGLSRFKKMWIYVNPGTGYWGPANRFWIASEITIATIIKA